MDQSDIESLLVAAYKRGFAWCRENEGDDRYLEKAARDYADATISATSDPALTAERDGTLSAAYGPKTDGAKP